VLSQEAGTEVNPRLLVGTLIDYCINLTQSSRDWMENVAVGQLPDDYKLYPGKMDHTTLMAFRISPNEAAKK
jgi:ABC-type antimicrobial peptide transport system ATPase subunit